MGIFDKIIGKKEEEKAIEKPKKKAEKVEAGKEKEKTREKKAKAPAKGKAAKKEDNLAHEILLEPLISEKGTLLGQFNKHLFRVAKKASKYEIKQAVEDYYGVKVTKVNIVRIRPKKRMHGRTVGWKKGFKKAVVTLQEGDTIGVAEGV